MTRVLDCVDVVLTECHVGVIFLPHTCVYCILELYTTFVIHVGFSSCILAVYTIVVHTDGYCCTPATVAGYCCVYTLFLQLV